MFLGHYAAGFVAKSKSADNSLGTMFAAALAADLLWSLLLLAGVERVAIAPGATAATPLEFESYPVSHSFVGSLLLAALLAGLYHWRRRGKHLWGATVVFLAVFSHWLLDLIVHKPDMPVLPGLDVRMGLGAWNSVWLSAVLEFGLFAGGFAYYIRWTEPITRHGPASLNSMAIVLAGIYAVNLFAPPPPNSLAVAIVGQLQWGFVIWAAIVDRGRRRRFPPHGAW